MTRLKLMLSLYTWSQTRYAGLFKQKKEAWGISKTEFLHFPEGTLGRALGEFYTSKGFDVMPKIENHDVFHLITETDTNIQDEIAMQYLLMGNGKISLYLVGMIGIGSLLYLDFLRYFIRSYQKGKTMQTFYDIEFKNLLDCNLLKIKTQIRTSKFSLIKK